MKVKVIIDTNVILDFFLSREPFAADARQLFSMVCQEKIEAFATASSITDIYYVTAKRLGEASAREAVKYLLKVLGIIGVDGQDCHTALDLPIADFEDALIVACSHKETISYIVTNDKEFLELETDYAVVLDIHSFIRLYSNASASEEVREN